MTFAREEKRFAREHFTFARQQKRFAGEHLLLLVRKSDLLASISLLLVRKSDLLVSILLFIISKTDFLVADELASFSDDLSTLRRTPAWPSATVRRPPHSGGKLVFGCYGRLHLDGTVLPAVVLSFG